MATLVPQSCEEHKIRNPIPKPGFFDREKIAMEAFCSGHAKK